MRPSPPLLSSLPPTIRAILARSASLARPSSTPSGITPAQPSVDDEKSTVRGWVKSVRTHKNVSFAAITDGSTNEVLQAVFKGQPISEQLAVGASVELKGALKPSKGKGQGWELVVSESKIVGECDPAEYPIQKKHLPEHVLRDQAHLRFKTTLTAATMRVRDGLMRDWHDWFEENEFVHIHTPIMTSSDCEGAGEVFRLQNPTFPSSSSSPSKPQSPATAIGTLTSTSTTVTSDPTSPSTTPVPATFFPRPVNLTVSSQLHLECPTHSLSRTYTLSPSFRSEKSMTSRHLAEFYMLEGEVVIDTLDSLLDVVEDGIRSTLHKIVHSPSGRAERLRRDLEAIAVARIPEGERIPPRIDLSAGLVKAAHTPFKRLTYTQAIELLTHNASSAQFGIAPEWGAGLSTEHEKFLARHFDGPVFITHYPASLKPFYMLPSSVVPGHSTSSISTPEPTVACFDLVVPDLGELIGGSLREHRLDALGDAIKRAGLKSDEYAWYTDLRRFGSVPHGGWGMGWERWICWVTGVTNVRDVVAFPRWMGHCKY